MKIQQKMKMLVTGGTGFLGKRLALRLKDEGYVVTILGRNDKIGLKLHEYGIQYVQGSLENGALIDKLCKGQDFVFHCGAKSSPWGTYQDFFYSNVIGTRHIVESCLSRNVKRLIHISSPSIYFRGQSELEISENQNLPTRYVNNYIATKRLAEIEVDKGVSRGLQAITLRPRALFGPEDRTIFPRLIERNEHGGIPLFRKGKVLIDITYIDNLVDAVLLCMEASESAIGQKFNITNGEPWMFIDLLQKLFQYLNRSLHTRKIPYTVAVSIAYMLEKFYTMCLRGKEPPITRYTIGVLAKSQTLDISAAKTVLSYKPRVNIEQGLKLYADWLIREGNA